MMPVLVGRITCLFLFLFRLPQSIIVEELRLVSSEGPSVVVCTAQSLPPIIPTSVPCGTGGAYVAVNLHHMCATSKWHNKRFVGTKPSHPWLGQTTSKTQWHPNQQRSLGIQGFNNTPGQGVYTTEHDPHAPREDAQHSINSVSAMATTSTNLVLGNSRKQLHV